MIQEESVKKLIDEILEVEKQAKVKDKDLGKDVTSKEGYKKLPAYNSIYVDSVMQKDRIKVHANPDHFPFIIFNERSPNQTDEQFKYVKNNYQCTTNPVWIDYQNVIGRSFIDSNWNIIYNEDTDEQKDFQEYVTSEVPIYGSVENFVTQVLPPIKGMDANGIIAVRPYRFVLTENPEGETIIDDQQRIEPTIYYHDSKNVLKTGDNFVLCVDDEKSLVTVGDKVVKEGRVMFLYTTETIYKIIQVGEKSKNDYSLEWQYDHNEKVVPATKLKGVPVINTHGKIYWVSRFYYAVPLLDLALSNRNILQVSINSSVFPFRVMMASECDFSDGTSSCANGSLILSETGEKSGTCPRCNGSGQAIPVSPLGVYQWQQPNAIDGGGNFPAKPVEYISPDRAPLDFVREQVSEDTTGARSILHLNKSNTNVKGRENETATMQSIEQSEKYSFIKPESEQLFDIWDWILERMAWQRYAGVISDPYIVVPEILRPKTFDFRTEADIWNEIKVAREADAPPFVIHQLFYQLLTNAYSNSPETQQLFETVVTADKLFSLSEKDVALRKAANTIDNYELTLHHSGLQLARMIMLEDDNYLSKELDERVSILIERAKSDTFTPTNSIIDSIINN